jgi:hypothetical protein
VSTPTIFKRASVDDPQGRQWTIVVDDRLDPRMERLARDTAERYGRYTMTIVAPDGRTVEVLKDAHEIQVDRELARFQAAIAAGDWGVELAPLAAEPEPPA